MTSARSGQRRRVAALPVAIAMACALLVAACGRPGAATFPPAGVTPPPAGDATAGVRAQVASLLAVEGLQLVDAQTPYRPPEGAIFAGTPRTVVQAVLPLDPAHGFIVLYAFPTPQLALAGAQDEAAYLASGPGKVQLTPGTEVDLRVVGNIAILFAWAPDNAPDPKTPSIALALSQLGDEVPIPA